MALQYTTSNVCVQWWYAGKKVQKHLIMYVCANIQWGKWKQCTSSTQPTKNQTKDKNPKMIYYRVYYTSMKKDGLLGTSEIESIPIYARVKKEKTLPMTDKSHRQITTCQVDNRHWIMSVDFPLSHTKYW